MKKLKNRIKKAYLFVYSLFVLLLHIPFVFAKSKPINRLGKTLTSNKITTAVVGGLQTTGNTLTKLPLKLYDSLKLNSLGLANHIFEHAITGLNKLKEMGTITNDSIISIVDFTQASANKRLFVLDVKNKEVIYNTYVAHGINSGVEYATSFSNHHSAHKSSLGFYKTGSTYYGSKGFSLKLVGLEKGFNDNAMDRGVVMHGANYVNENYIKSQGWIGRSHGCPAVAPELNRPIIETIKDGSLFFIYGNDMDYLNNSAILN